MPGSASRAKARSDGSALLSDWSAGRPTFRTSRSCGIVAFRLSSWTAKAAIVRLRFVTKPLSASSLRASAPNTFPWLLEKAREVVVLGAEIRLGDLGAVAVRALPVADGLVEAGGARALERRRELVEDDPEVLALVAPEHVLEHLVLLGREVRLVGGSVSPDSSSGALGLPG